ncbi:DNA polymerase IV [Bacillota bacterium Meth-B3]
MGRVILHSDANSYYASVECLYTPSIREKPVAVCGDPEARHGIVLTKNQIAKKFGIQTGEAIWQAKQKCPSLVVVPPDYDLYVHFSEKMRAIYAQYTDRVEAFGLDENWIGLTQPGMDIREGTRIAHEIRSRVREELGITVSVGVSFNKVFAKLGSDMKKPDAVTVIGEDGYREKIWPLPVSELLYVGPQTTKKLMKANVNTIGQLANMDLTAAEGLLGKNGVMLKAFAMGLDESPVMKMTATEAVKSVGNSTTPPHDLESDEDVKRLCYLLSESIARRLRAQGFRAGVVSISVRDVNLTTNGCQRKLGDATSNTGEIARMAYALYMERYRARLPLRSMGISCGSLVPEDAPVQLSMLGDDAARERRDALERTLDSLRYRFGHQVIQRAVVLADRQYAAIDPTTQTIHPVAFLREDRGVNYARPS